MPHIHNKSGQFDFTVEVFIVFKNKVLLRKHDKYGLWLGVGGHIELNEDPNQTAIREVKEEVGLDIKLINKDKLAPVSGLDIELTPPFHLNKHAINKEHGHITMIYYAKALNDKVTPEKPEDEWLWLTSEDINNGKINIMPNIKYFALEALELVSSRDNI